MNGRDAITDRVNDLGNQRTGFQVIARFCAEHQQASDGRCDGFNPGQRGRRVHEGRKWRGLALNGAIIDQVVNQCLTVLLG